MTQYNENIIHANKPTVYSLEERGHVVGLGHAEDLTLFADADIVEGMSFRREDGSDHDDLSSISSSSSLQASDPPQDYAVSFDRIDPTEKVPQGQKHLVVPSGATGAFLGLCLGGPIGAALWGFAAAYAVRKEGTLGDLARSLGEIGLTAQAKFLELDQKHQLGTWAQETIEESTVAGMAAQGFNSIAEYTKRHQLLERGVENTGRGFEYLAEKISGTPEPDPIEEERRRLYQLVQEDFERHNDGTFY